MESNEAPPESVNEGETTIEKNAEETAALVIESGQESPAPESAEVAVEPEEGVPALESDSAEVEPEAEEDTAAPEPESEPEFVTESEPEAPQAEAEPGEETAASEPAEVEPESESDEEIAVPEEVVERPEGTAWYVVHSYSGYENKVRKNLLQRIESMEMGDQIFDVIVPTEEEVEIKDGHRRIYKKRVFPGYILVEMLLTENSWYVVRNTPGVTGFVGSGNEPTPLRQNEVDKIINRMEVETPTIRVGFREGQTVRITDGPFSDFMGTVDEIFLDRGKVRVLVSMFGRETPIELDFLQVEKL